jgi:4-diphosphocytidyl-2-C-methyl-D-erythritol kinase
MKSLTLPAPAKLNLFLHITGRREDGYHTLQTVFQLLDVHDDITLSLRDDDKLILQCDHPELANDQNLVLKAARLLQSMTGTSQGADINLIKRLPLGGGLGGGSSDAATTLVGLNKLWQTGLNEEALAALGLALGADVPVFIRGKSAWAEGVGEVLFPMTLNDAYYLIIIPNCTVSTGEIFTDKDLTRNTAPITMATFLAKGGHNDCEPVARRLHAPVNEALSWLTQHAPNARMTGTGACVFAKFDSLTQAQHLLNDVPRTMRAFVARGVNESALHQAISQHN